MSGYRELCQTYRESRLKYLAYRDEIHAFAEGLMAQLVELWAVPAEKIRFFPMTPNGPGDYVARPAEALLFGNDGFWYLGVEIVLRCDDCPETPEQAVHALIGLKRSGDSFVIKLGEKETKLVCETPDAEGCGDFFSAFHKTIRDYLKGSVNRFLESKPSACRIGFTSGCE